MKKVLSLILSAAAVLCLAGCDNSSGITSISNSSSSSSSSKSSSSSNSSKSSVPENKPESKPESAPVSSPESTPESTPESIPEGATEKSLAILQYLNTDLLPVGELEEKVLTSYSSVTGNKYKSDNIMLNEFSTKTLPLARQLHEAAVDVKQKISDPEILAIHKKYITYSEKLIETLTLMISALKNQNMDTMNSANQMLNEANASVLEYRNEITALANKNGVTIGGQG